MRRALTYLVYPAMTGGAVLFGLWAIGAHWPFYRIGLVVIVAATVLTAFFERLIPYRRAWAQPRGDRLTDAYHMLISNRGFDLGTFIAAALLSPIGAWLHSQLGVGLWPHLWPVPLQAACAMMVYELGWYGIHRLEHGTGWLWRLHAVHHSSRRIYWWNFARAHPIDNVITAIAAYAPLAFCGVGTEPIALMVAFSTAHGLLQHSNIDLHTGFLDWIFSTPRVHRWHHAPDRQASAVNFAPRLMIWDHLFGSYYFSKAPPPEEVGLGAGDAYFPTGYLGQLLIPFRAGYWRAQR